MGVDRTQRRVEWQHLVREDTFLWERTGGPTREDIARKQNCPRFSASLPMPVGHIEWPRTAWWICALNFIILCGIITMI